MAHRIIITLLLLSTLILTACESDAYRHRRSVSMNAEVDTMVVPDRVAWTIKINDLDPELKKAKQAVDAKLDAIGAALAEVAVEDGSLRTGATRVQRQYRRCNDGVNRFSHFLVERTLTFRQDELAAVEATMDKLVTAGEMEVSFLYEISRPEVILEQLRLRAMDRARGKAESLAGHAGASLGKLQSIHVHEDRLEQQLHRNRNMVELKGIAGPEAQRLATRVNVSYDLH